MFRDRRRILIPSKFRKVFAEQSWTTINMFAYKHIAPALQKMYTSHSMSMKNHQIVKFFFYITKKRPCANFIEKTKEHVCDKWLIECSYVCTFIHFKPRMKLRFLLILHSSLSVRNRRSIREVSLLERKVNK